MLAGIKAPAPVRSEVEEDFEIWPEGWESWLWFQRFHRRWIFGARDGKRVRLDDVVVLRHLKTRGIKRKKRQVILDDLMVMETAAVEEFGRGER